MTKIKERMDELVIGGKCVWDNFWNNEKGDTNFISIAIIVSIVVVLACIFLAIGQNSMNNVGNKVNNFIK